MDLRNKALWVVVVQDENISVALVCAHTQSLNPVLLCVCRSVLALVQGVPGEQ